LIFGSEQSPEDGGKRRIWAMLQLAAETISKTSKPGLSGKCHGATLLGKNG